MVVLHTQHPPHPQHSSSVMGFLLFPLGPAALWAAWTPNGSYWNQQALQAALRAPREKRQLPSRGRRASLFQQGAGTHIAPVHQWTLYRPLRIWPSKSTVGLLTGVLTVLNRPLPEVSITVRSCVKNVLIRFPPSPSLAISLLYQHRCFSRQPWPSNKVAAQMYQKAYSQ